ncbi:hypothetical protein LJC15_00115 [Desulfovibrio sp. OttesenSCG-928-G11]|nr:hypothetical protein [Desulfovibrio sp. OttesenSCG-928-G11]
MINRQQASALIRRTADACEKFAVASFAIGAYDESNGAWLIGLVFLLSSYILTWRAAR